MSTQVSPDQEQDVKNELILQIQNMEYEISKWAPHYRPKTNLSIRTIRELQDIIYSLDTFKREQNKDPLLVPKEVSPPLDEPEEKEEVDIIVKSTNQNEAVGTKTRQALLAKPVQDVSTGREYFSLPVWGLMKEMAQTFIDSKALPSGIQNKEQMMMVLQAGYEKGMKPIESLQSFAIVNGRISMWGPAVLNRLKKSGWRINWDKSTNETCTMTISRGQESYTESYTLKEAQSAGITITKKDGKEYAKATWKSYPKLMLRYKCAQLHTKFNVPEVMENMYMTEEAEDIPLPPTEEKRKELKEKTERPVIDLA